MQRRKQIQLLAVLMGVLAITLWAGSRLNQPPAVVKPAAPATASSGLPSVLPADVRLHLDRLERHVPSAEAGTVNVFDYRLAPAAPPTPPPGARVRQPETLPVPLPTAGNAPPATVRPLPLSPPAPPIPLKYEGYASNSAGARGFTAFLAGDTKHYNVVEGEVLLGRYRVLRITNELVELEDLEFNRKQTLPLVK